VIDVFKDFHTRFERETGKKLKCISVEMVVNTGVFFRSTSRNIVLSWRK
jgi:hypothetical protein